MHSRNESCLHRAYIDWSATSEAQRHRLKTHRYYSGKCTVHTPLPQTIYLGPCRIVQLGLRLTTRHGGNTLGMRLEKKYVAGLFLAGSCTLVFSLKIFRIPSVLAVAIASSNTRTIPGPALTLLKSCASEMDTTEFLELARISQYTLTQIIH